MTKIFELKSSVNNLKNMVTAENQIIIRVKNTESRVRNTAKHRAKVQRDRNHEGQSGGQGISRQYFIGVTKEKLEMEENQ